MLKWKHHELYQAKREEMVKLKKSDEKEGVKSFSAGSVTTIHEQEGA